MELSNRYHIKQRLGNQHKRKFGSVFLGRDKTSGDRVVIKAIQKQKGSELITDRLRGEALFNFDFFGLPRILFVEESKTELFVVRCYVPGIPLNEYWVQIKRRKRLFFITQLIEKLIPIFDHLQGQGIVHCDIKPSNILIEQVTEDTIEVHLIDFGLALYKGSDFTDRKLLFPLGYAAPELLLNHLNLVDHRTDIFALGITIWHLYTGELPLRHPNPSIFTNLQLTHALPEHSELPTKVYRILKKMCSKHIFDLPPNKMNPIQVNSFLLSAIHDRTNSLTEVMEAFIDLVKQRKFW